MDYLKFHKWNEKDKNTLSKSSRENLGMKEIQFYQPYFSLYFHIHNTKNSHKKIDLERRYIIKKILNTSNEKYHTSNLFVNCQVLDKYELYLRIKDCELLHHDYILHIYLCCEGSLRDLKLFLDIIL